MLSYEIDALVADRFKASWERMVLLACLTHSNETSLVNLLDACQAFGCWIPIRGQELQGAPRIAGETLLSVKGPAWPRTEAEREWKNTDGNQEP